MLNEESVICCFCGENVKSNAAIEISFSSPQMDGGTQTVFAHPTCFDEKLHKSIPRILTEDKD